MSGFIEVTILTMTDTGVKQLINIDKIIEVYPNVANKGGGCKITVNSSPIVTYNVKDPYADIRKAIGMATGGIKCV